MAQSFRLRLLHHITVLCLMSSLTLASVYTETTNVQPKSKLHSQSHTYFDEISQVGTLAHRQQILKNQNIQKKLDKLYETLFHPLTTSERVSWNGDTWDSFNETFNTTDLTHVLMHALDLVAVNYGSSSRCLNDTKQLLTGIVKKEKWALQFLDSFGKPGPGLEEYRFNFVGDYAECRSAAALLADNKTGFSGNYCTLKASIGPANTLSLFGVQLGACAPDTCSEEELTLFVASALPLLPLNISLLPAAAECHTGKKEMTTATVVAITVVIIIGLLMITGTTVDIICVQRPKWKIISVGDEGILTNNHMSECQGYGPIGEDNQTGCDETSSLLGGPKFVRQGGRGIGTCCKILLAFSVYTNGSKVLNTSQAPGSLTAIHGIRFLSMSWVVLGHVFAFGFGQVGNVVSEFRILLTRWTFDAIANAFLSVDTFFTLSGLLTAYLSIKEMKKRGWKINWPLAYFHRFWRLTPPYMLSLLIVLGFQQYLGSGALWSDLQPADKSNCENYWWANLLYINNLIDPDKMCFGHSWYLANDMQFFWLSPLMLIPLFLNVYLGMAICVGFLLICFITTGVLSTQHGWPATVVSLNPNIGLGGDLIMATWFRDYYIKPWCRIGAYVVGVMAGYYLAVNNGRIKMRWYTVGLGWMAAITAGLAVMYGLRGDIGGDNLSSIGAAALYNAISRPIWGACVCWVIIACVSGYGGFVNSILSWSPFVVLGRLTYMAYLIHPCLISSYFQNGAQLFYLTDISIAVTFCGLLVIINMIAFGVMLALESPMIGLEKTFIRERKKE